MSSPVSYQNNMQRNIGEPPDPSLMSPRDNSQQLSAFLAYPWGVEGRGRDGIRSVRANPGTEHAQLDCSVCLSLLPRAKWPASENDTSKLCQDMIHEMEEVLKTQKFSRDKSCALAQILPVIKVLFGSPSG